MKDDTILDPLEENTNEMSFSDNPDYLQEQSDIIRSLKNPQTTEIDPNLKDAPYSKQYEVKAKAHMSQVEQTLAQARAQGDYGTPEIGPDGQPLLGDVPFLETPSTLPDELKKEEDQ